MKNHTLILYKNNLEEDALGNTVPVGNGAPLLTTWARATFYNAEKTDVGEGRTLTTTRATISAPITYAQALAADYLVMDGSKYRILDVIDAQPRWSVFIAEVWRA